MENTKEVKSSQEILTDFLSSLQKQFSKMSTKEIYHTVSEQERIRKEAAAL